MSYKYTMEEITCNVCNAQHHRVKLVDKDTGDAVAGTDDADEYLYCPGCDHLGFVGDSRTR